MTTSRSRRNHTTSSASRQKPETKAAASHGPPERDRLCLAIARRTPPVGPGRGRRRCQRCRRCRARWHGRRRREPSGCERRREAQRARGERRAAYAQRGEEIHLCGCDPRHGAERVPPVELSQHGAEARAGRRQRLGEEGQRDAHGRRGNEQQQKGKRQPDSVQYPGVVEQGTDPGRQQRADSRQQMDQADAGQRDGDLGGRVRAHRVPQALAVARGQGVAEREARS